MPNWKKVIISGSDASLNTLEITSGSAADLTVIGNVGIGTTNPTEKLTVEGNISGSGDLLLSHSSTPMVKLVDTTNDLQARFRAANNYAYLSVDNPNTVASSRLIFQVDGSEALHLDSSLDANFAGNVNTVGDITVTNVTTPTITLTDTTNSSTLTLSTGNFDSAITSNGRLYINSSTGLAVSAVGAVGVGVGNPVTSKFQVTGTSYLNGLTAVGTTPVTGKSLVVRGTGTTSATTALLIEDNAGTDLLAVRDDGNVGIAVTNPLVKLSVGGEINAVGSTGNIRADNLSGAVTLGSRGGLYNDQNLTSDTNNSISDLVTYTAAGKYHITVGAVTNKVLTVSGSEVGIGTQTPTEKLHVSGSVRVEGAYYDSNNSPGTAGQILSSTVSGSDWIDASAGNIDGSGTTNYIAKWSDSDTITDSQIFDNGTNVGIGTTSPGAKLHVEGNVLIDAYSQGVDNGLFFRQGFLTIDQPSIIVWDMTNGGASPDGLSINANDGIRFRENGGEVARFKDGNLGIGTTTPSHKIDVSDNSTTWAGKILNTNANGQGLLVRSDATTATALAFGVYSNGSVGAGYKFIVQADGNVGIGTTSPSYKLSVNGDIHIPQNEYIYFDNAAHYIRRGASNVELQGYNGLDLRTEGSSRILINQAGNVGIGTTTPGSYDTALIGSGHKFLNVQASSTNYAVQTLAGDSGTNGNRLGYLTFVNDNNNATYKYSAWIGSEVEGTTANKQGGRLIFSTTSDNSTAGPIERMRITSTGEVLIGQTANNGNRLQITGADGASYIYLKTDVATTGGRIGFNGDVLRVFNQQASGELQLGTAGSTKMTISSSGATSFSGTAVLSATVASIQHLSSNGYLYIKGGTGGLILGDDSTASRIQIEDNSNIRFETASSERMRILANGNVGIGTTSPGEMLHIENSSGANIILNSNTGAVNNGIYMSEGSSSTPTINGAYFYYDSSANAVKLDTGTTTLSTRFVVQRDTGNVTFAGNVDLGDSSNITMAVGAPGQLQVKGSGYTGAVALDATAMYIYHDSALRDLVLGTNETARLTISGNSGNTAITGVVTAPTFSGDLNGTINTLTTAVTKANATSDTTVATTAFVQNLIGTIPAGLVFQGTWNAATNTPTLTNGSGTTGHFYIVSTDGSTNLDGITDWKVGDWAVFVEQGATDAWEKVDNSSVLDGSGTGQKVALWSGSGTSNTLTDAPITVSGNNATFAGDVTITNASSHAYLSVDAANAGASEAGIFLKIGGTTKWETYTAANDGNYNIWSAGQGIKLAITPTGNATFAGMVSVNGGGIDIDNNDDVRLRFDNAGTFKAGLQVSTTAGDMIAGSAVNDFAIRSQGNMLFASGGNIEKLRLDTSGNATFAGKITSGNDIVNATAGVYTWVGDTDTYIQRSASNEITFKTGASNALVLDSSQNATFAGDVNVGEFLLMKNNKELRWLDSGGTQRTVLELDSSDNLYLGKSGGGNLYIVNGTNYTTAVTIDSAQNATFAGNVLLNGYLSVEGTTGNTGGATDRWIGGDGTAGTWFYNVPTGSSHLFGINNSNILTLNGTGATFAGNVTVQANLKFDESGVRSWNVGASSGNLNITSGDSSGTVAIDTGLSVQDNATFAGNVNITNAGAPVLRLTNTTASQSWIQYVGSNDDFIIADETDSTTPLIINGSGNATFAGNVNVDADINIIAANISNQENADVDTGIETVATVPIVAYTAAFFDYVVKKGLNVRAGTVHACHDGINVQYIETSTLDLGNTFDLQLSVDITGPDMRLRATAASDDWSVKTLTRAL